MKITQQPPMFAGSSIYSRSVTKSLIIRLKTQLSMSHTNSSPCPEAVMFYIQTFQLCAISFQVACTNIYFMSNPPPQRSTGKFSDTDYLSLLSASFVQTRGLALSLVGIRKWSVDTMWIWSLAVAIVSFGLSVASLVLYFVYTTLGDLYMCLAAVCQLWIWKFVIFGARKSKDEVGSGERNKNSGSDIEMQPLRTGEDS